MKDTNIVNPIAKLEYIDIVRGIAILMVILTHTSQTINGTSKLLSSVADYGQTGVQLFFVASAYTLCFSHLRRAKEKKSLLSFFIRRFFRIAPLYYLAIVGYSLIEPWTHILARIQLPYSEYNFKTIFANILFVHGFVMSANNNVVPGGWSIGAEAAFYAVFPMLFTLFCWAYKQRGIIGLYALVGFSIFLNIAIQLTLQMFFSIQIASNAFIYWNIINQLPVFLLGMTIFFHHHYKIKISLSTAAQIGIFIAITVIFIILLQFKGNWIFRSIPVGAGISFIFLVDILKRTNFSSKIIEKFGRLSYSIYILHFFSCFYLIPIIVGVIGKSITPDLLFFLSFVLVIIFTFGLARFSHRYIETPGIQLGRILISRL